ncbi:MAG: MoaD/ThiS family protein [Actinomycetes bacterium]
MAEIEVRFYGGAAEAAATTMQMCQADDLTDLVAQLGREHGDRLRRILSISSVLVDGLVQRPGSRAPLGDCRVDVLPPYAGG